MSEKDSKELYDNYSVNVVGLMTGWMIYDIENEIMSKEGHDFLSNICRSNELEYFEIDSIQIMI